MQITLNLNLQNKFYLDFFQDPEFVPRHHWHYWVASVSFLNEYNCYYINLINFIQLSRNHFISVLMAGDDLYFYYAEILHESIQRVVVNLFNCLLFII